MYRSSWFLTTALVGINIALVQNIAQAKSPNEIETIARSFTVKIRLQQDESSGSGVIIHRQGDLYTLVTNSHVACGANLQPDRLCERLPAQEEYSIDMFDGQRYKVPVTNVKILSNDLDLAIIQFRSSTSYPIAKLASIGKTQTNQSIYTAGFTPAGFSFNGGEMIAVVNRKIAGDVGGYTIIYSAATLAGMSGGGAFDANGQLVAIQGRGNTSKIGSSRGIPISFLARKLALIGINIATYSQTEPVLVPPFSAEEYFVAGYNKFVDPGPNAIAGIQQSIKYFSWAIQLNPRYTFAYFRRAYAYEQVQELQKSLTDYNQAILLNPRYAEAYNSRANLKGEKLNDLAGALVDYNQAIMLDARYAEAYHGRAILKAEKLNDFKGALADYNLAILSNPKLAEAYHGRAILKAGKLSDGQGALLDYNQAIAISPEYSDAYFNRANLKKNRLADRSGAIQDYLQAARLYRQQGKTADLQDALRNLQQLGGSE
jgi:tetratricopeptide (TPR) repeat protein